MKKLVDNFVRGENKAVIKCIASVIMCGGFGHTNISWVDLRATTYDIQGPRSRKGPTYHLHVVNVTKRGWWQEWHPTMNNPSQTFINVWIWNSAVQINDSIWREKLLEVVNQKCKRIILKANLWTQDQADQEEIVHLFVAFHYLFRRQNEIES